MQLLTLVQPSCTALMAATIEFSFQALSVWCLLGLTSIAAGAELERFLASLLRGISVQNNDPGGY